MHNNGASWGIIWSRCTIGVCGYEIWVGTTAKLTIRLINGSFETTNNSTTSVDHWPQTGWWNIQCLKRRRANLDVVCYTTYTLWGLINCLISIVPPYPRENNTGILRRRLCLNAFSESWWMENRICGYDTTFPQFYYGYRYISQTPTAGTAATTYTVNNVTE